MATWELFSRAADFTPTGGLPIISVDMIAKHLGVSTAVISTPYSEDAWSRLDKGCGASLRRNGTQQFGGVISSRQFVWDAESGKATIKANLLGDLQVLADRITFPDPLRAPDDQTVNDYWTFTGPASSAMLQLISDQAGATCRPDRAVSGLALGADPLLGVSQKWQGLFDNVFELLTQFSVTSGTDLGLRSIATPGGGLRIDVYAPNNLEDTVRFSADLRNLVGIAYTEVAPTVTDGVVAGQGDLHARQRVYVQTADAESLTWGRRVWSYVDRRDTADTPTLTQAGTDATAAGVATVNLAVTLTDSQAATYGRDWGLGDLITVYVGLPGATKVATVSDVVREIHFTVDEKGAEKITPAIGTYDAKAVIPTPTQQKVAAVGAALNGLITRK